MAPTGILSIEAQLTHKHDLKGLKGPGLQGPCVKAILAVLFSAEPSWWCAPTGILSIVALLTNKHDRIGTLMMKPDTIYTFHNCALN